MPFNLVTQPWILAGWRDRQRSPVSLLNLFRHWDEILEIQAESPPATYAIYRLLGTILHRAYGGPVDAVHWRDIHRDNGKEAIAYLQEWHDRFDLLHPEQPFLQDPLLPPDLASPFYLAVWAQPDSTPTHFCSLHRFSGYQPDAATVARAIVRLQCFDLAGLKTGYPGYSGGTSAIAPPTINAINVLVQGATLRDTLCLNLAPYDIAGTGDRPGWETDQYAGMPRTAVVPTGLLHYRTMAWRRIRWVEGRGIVVTPGDRLDSAVDVKPLEPSMAWRHSEKEGDRPVRFSRERAAWRNAHVLLTSTQQHSRPAILDWVAELDRAGLRESQKPTGLVLYGWSADKAKPLGWHEERLPISLQMLRDPTAGSALTEAIAWAEACGQVFRSFGGSPYGRLAEGLGHGEPKQLAEGCAGGETYWATVGAQVPSLLWEIAHGQHDPAAWHDRVRQIALKSFRDSIDRIQNPRARAKALNSVSWWLFTNLEKPKEDETRDATTARTGRKRKA